MEAIVVKDATEKYGDMIFRLALCRLQNIQDAEDVYQESFLRMLKKADTSWNEEHMKAWLIRTALNLCTDILRGRGRFSETPIDPASVLSDNMKAEEILIWKEVAALPDKYRTVIHLYYAEGYDTAEIARILHMPHSTVRVRLKRGREMLKKRIGGLEDDK